MVKPERYHLCDVVTKYHQCERAEWTDRRQSRLPTLWARYLTSYPVDLQTIAAPLTPTLLAL